MTGRVYRFNGGQVSKRYNVALDTLREQKRCSIEMRWMGEGLETYRRLVPFDPLYLERDDGFK